MIVLSPLCGLHPIKHIFSITHAITVKGLYSFRLNHFGLAPGPKPGKQSVVKFLPKDAGQKSVDLQNTDDIHAIVRKIKSFDKIAGLAIFADG